MKHKYLRDVTTLTYNKEKCIGCGMCVTVCPHRIFKMNERKALIVDKDSCMECGACAVNCPAMAITVNAGTGCATAILYNWATGNELACGCSDNSTCC